MPIIALIVATAAAAVAIDMATMTFLAIRERMFGVVGLPGQDFGELEDFLFGVEGVFIATAFWSLDHDLYDISVVGITGGESDGVGEASFFLLRHGLSFARLSIRCRASSVGPDRASTL